MHTSFWTSRILLQLRKTIAQPLLREGVRSPCTSVQISKQKPNINTNSLRYKWSPTDLLARTLSQTFPLSLPYILPYILSLSIHEANKMHLTGATLLLNIGAHFRRALKFGPSCAEAH